MTVIILTGLFAAACLVDLPLLLQKTNKRRKTWIIYAALMSAAYLIALLLVIDKAPLSPSVIIEKVVKMVLG